MNQDRKGDFMQVNSSLESLKEDKKIPKIDDIEAIPNWAKKNANIYLKTGYRINFHSFKLSVKSLFMRHNELLNVWTHLIGAIMFIGLLIFLAFHIESAKSIYNNVKTDISNIKPFFNNLKKTTKNQISDQYTNIVKKDFSNYKEYLTNFKDKFHSNSKIFVTNFDKNFQNFLSKIDTIKKKLITYIKKTKKKSHLLISQKLKTLLNFDKIMKSLLPSLNYTLEYYPIIIFLFSAIFCLGSSAIFHLFNEMDKRIFKILHKIDLAGISILICGSCFPITYYYFYCLPFHRYCYTFFSCFTCILVFGVSLGDWINKSENNHLKGLMYGTLGISNILPITHLILLSVFAKDMNGILPPTSIFFGLFLMAFFYLFGLSFYIMRFPEKYYPKKFDIWCNSHTIFHSFVVIATCVHYYTVDNLYKLRNDNMCTLN